MRPDAEGLRVRSRSLRMRSKRRKAGNQISHSRCFPFTLTFTFTFTLTPATTSSQTQIRDDTYPGDVYRTPTRDGTMNTLQRDNQSATRPDSISMLCFAMTSHGSDSVRVRARAYSPDCVFPHHPLFSSLFSSVLARHVCAWGGCLTPPTVPLGYVKCSRLHH